MKALALALALLAACSMSKSAERQDSFGQEVESRRDEGPWTREVWEYEARAGGRGAPETAYPPSAAVRPQDLPDSNRATLESKSILPAGGILRHVVETHSPVTSTTTTSTKASGEAHTASAQRFGFSPWQWAIGAAVLAALAYGAFWVRRKLGF